MAWQDEMVEILRGLVMDNDSETYTDDTLEKTLCIAAFQVVQELPFEQSFTISVSNRTISPDPTVTSTKDDSFVNLVTLKAACNTDRGSAIQAASQAIMVKDGSSQIDLRTVFGSKLALIKEGWCSCYKDAKLEYQSGNYAIAGAIIMSPFRTCITAEGDGFYVDAPGREREPE